MESNKKQERVTKLVNSWLERNDDMINRLQLKAAENYTRFFEWSATELYQLYVETKAYKKLAEIIKQHTLEEVAMYLSNAIKRREDEALEHFNFCHSTSPLHNLASEAQFMADREIRKYFKRLLDIIKEED